MSAVRLLLLRQAISVFHTIILSFDHTSTLVAHFHADLALTQNYTAAIYQLRQYFERREQETSEKMVEGEAVSTVVF